MSMAERMEALRRPMRQNSVEDALETLRKYNTVIVVDDSGSMAGNRWKEVSSLLLLLRHKLRADSTTGSECVGSPGGNCIKVRHRWDRCLLPEQ